MPIDRDEVRRIADLANLELDPAQLATFSAQLESILGYVALLDALEIGDMEPAPEGGEPWSSLRRDVERKGLTVEEALTNAPDGSAGQFRVPRVLGE